MMTKLEVAAKKQLQKLLNEQGYPTYSRLLDHVHVNLTDDPQVVAYLDTSSGRIVLNRDLGLEQVSMVVRHELLHEYLSHMLRMERHVGKDKWANRSLSEHQMSNIAGDYEISNRGYTDADKLTARTLKIGNKVVQGLVTDIDHPDWVNLSLEEMYDKLQDEMEEFEKQALLSVLRIGNKGDKNTQDAENALRAAEAVINDADEVINDDSASASEKKEAAEAKQAALNALKELADATGETASSSSSSNSSDHSSSQDSSKGSATEDVFKKDPEKEVDKAAARIAKIIQNLSNATLGAQLEDETVANIEREKHLKAIRDAEKYRRDPIRQFVDSLNQFIKKELGYERGNSWAKINKTYANSDIMRPGRSRRATGKIPVVNVYFDASGSWTSNPWKWQIGERGLATLDQYVRQGKLKVNKWYFSDYHKGKPSVYRTPEEATGGNYDSVRCVVEHIKQTKPDNVVIMTDSDPRDTHPTVTVPGACWFLFVEGESPEFESSIRGNKLTKKLFIKN